MATERELNKRIKSIKNISQVTSALAAVSASKASRAQRQVEATRAYAGKAFEILNNLASQPDVGHPLLTAREEIKNSALILVTGDRGMDCSIRVPGKVDDAATVSHVADDREDARGTDRLRGRIRAYECNNVVTPLDEGSTDSRADESGATG